MEKETVELITSQLDKIAAKLGTTVEQIWPWLIRQQYVDAFWSLGLLIVFSIFGYMGYQFIKKVNWDKFEDESSVEQVVGIAVGIISGGAIIAVSIYFLNVFPDIFNAEYWALKDLFNMVK